MAKKKKKLTKKDADSAKRLKAVYFAPAQPGSYGGVNAVRRAVDEKQQKKKKKKKISTGVVKHWLSKQETYSLHKPVRRKFPRRRVVVSGLDDQWQADLADVQSLAKYNGGHRYLLACIDVLSKYAWVVPLKDKTGKSLVGAFSSVFDGGRVPRCLQTDKGTEFTNSLLQKYLAQRGVSFFTTENEDTKAQICERFLRTLKGKMFKHFTQKQTRTYTDVLDKLVTSYNATHHSSIDTSPASVNVGNAEAVWQTLYGGHCPPKARPRFRVGDLVRISTARGTFKKGYLPNWSRELFSVVSVRSTQPPTYTLEDQNGENVRGTFYEAELQRIGEVPETYKIEKVLGERKKKNITQVLVKWLGYSDTFNSWINKTDLKEYKG